MQRWLFLAVLVALPRGAAADDPKFVYSSHDDVKGVKGVEWTATAEAGLVLTTGNSETTTATGGFHVSRKTGKNKFALEASGAYAKSGLRVPIDRSGNGLIDDQSEIVTAESITAETLQGKARYDRFLTASNSLYIAALASRDTPAGKRFAVGGQLGYSRQLYKSKTAETVAELGYDFSEEQLVADGSNAIHSARLFVGHKGALTEGCDLDLSLEMLTNLSREELPTMKDGGPLEDTRVDLRFAVSAQIGKNLAIQTSIEAKYDHRPGPLPVDNLAPGFVPEALPLDTILKLQLIYTFVGTPPKK